MNGKLQVILFELFSRPTLKYACKNSIGDVGNSAQATAKTTPSPVSNKLYDHVVIAQWLAWQLATSEVPGSNLGKGENIINF